MDSTTMTRQLAPLEQGSAASFTLPHILNRPTSPLSLNVSTSSLNAIKESLPARGNAPTVHLRESFSDENKSGLMTESVNQALAESRHHPKTPMHVSPTYAADAVGVRTEAAERGTAAEMSLEFCCPLLASSAGSDAVAPPEAGLAPGAWHHALVVFDKLFCVCFVPLKMRTAMKVGELVLCEYGSSENTATVVADVSVLVMGAVAERQAALNVQAASLDAIFEPAVERALGINSNVPGMCGPGPASLYSGKAVSGLAGSHEPCRMPCVLRRGTNRDKKRVYFSRLRSNDALAAAQRMLANEHVTAIAAEYQVNFSCATIYLAGDREECMLSPQQFQQLGNSLSEPLRCETVEFRFWSERGHGELDLTRAIVGSQHSELLHNAVANHQRSQSGKTTQRAAPQANAAHPPAATTSSSSSGSLNAGVMGTAANFAATQTWSHPTTVPAVTSIPAMAFLQRAPPSQPPPMSYTVGPPIYVAQQPQPQQQQQQPVMQGMPQPPSLAMMQGSPYPTFNQISGATGTYVTGHVSPPYYDSVQQQQQQQQQQPHSITLQPNQVSGSQVYFVLPSSTAMQWDPSSPLPYVDRLGQQLPQRQQQQRLGSVATYVQGPATGMQGYPTISYPVVFSSSGFGFNPFQM